MRAQKSLHYRFHFPDYSFILFQYKEQFVIVGFEFILLKQDDSGRFRNFDSDSIHAFGFSDQLHYFQVEIHIKFLVFLVSHNQSGLQCSLWFFNLIAPGLIIPHFIDSQLFSESIVTSIVSLDFLAINDMFREHIDWSCYFLEQMSSPDNFSGIGRHISDNGGIRLLVCENTLDSVQFSGIIVQDCIVFSG